MRDIVEPVDCPRCGLINPSDAMRCDCGYDFVEGVAKDDHLDPHEIAHRDLARHLRAEQAGAVDDIDYGLDTGDAADASEVWDNCDLLGCPPGCDGNH